MNIQTLKEKTIELIKQHPDKKDELVDFFQLALDEIEEGGSEMHECELAYSDMLEVIKG
jgi:hypothetical protein